MLIRKSGVSWVEQNDQICDEEQHGIEPGFPFLFDFDASFIDGYSQADNCNPGQSVSVSNHGVLQSLDEMQSTLGHTPPWVNGDQWMAQGAASTSSTRYDHPAPMSSNTRPNIGKPASFEPFNLYSGSHEANAFVEPNNTWISPSSLQITGKPLEDACAPTSHHDFHGVAAKPNEVLEPIFDQRAELAIPPFTGLLDLEAPQQGIEASQDPIDYTESALKFWLGGAIPDAALDQGSRTLVSYEIGNDLPGTNQNLSIGTAKSANKYAAILAPVASTAITKADRRPKAPNADLTLANALGKFATSRSRKPFSKDRRQEVAMTRQIGACFRCKIAKVTVCSIQKQ